MVGFRQRFNSNILEPRLGQMFLQQDDARSIRKILNAADFALRDLGLPVLAADRGLHNLLAVEPVFNVTVVHNDLAVVEFVDGIQMLLVGNRRVEIVEGASRFLRSSTVFVPLVVEYLELTAIIGTAAIRVGLLRQILYAAVAALGDPPFEFQLEILERSRRLNIPGSFFLDFDVNGTVDNLPSFGDRLVIQGHPAIECLAIKQGDKWIVRDARRRKHHDKQHPTDAAGLVFVIPAHA